MKPVLTYAGAHKRVERVRGKAREYPCFGCGEAQAAQWGYDHSDPNVQQGPVKGPGTTLCEFSSDPWHYVPLCVLCHFHWDAKAEGWRAAASRGGSISKRVSPHLSWLRDNPDVSAINAAKALGVTREHVYRLRKKLVS